MTDYKVRQANVAQNQAQIKRKDPEQEIKQYMREHKCSMQQATQALGYPPPQPPKQR